MHNGSDTKTRVVVEEKLDDRAVPDIVRRKRIAGGSRRASTLDDAFKASSNSSSIEHVQVHQLVIGHLTFIPVLCRPPTTDKGPYATVICISWGYF